MVPLTTAVITNAGTATTTGYRILVAPGGTAFYQTPAFSGSMTLPANVYSGFFADLKAAQPLSTLPTGQCAGGGSGAAPLTVQLGGQTTPDLACPINGAEVAIVEDVQKIVESLGVRVGPAKPGQPNVPVMTY